MTTTTSPILVIGGTGKTGRRVAERLAARGLPLRIGSRSAAIPFDWEDRATWAPALHGASAAYVAFYPDISVEGATAAIAELAATARAEGVARIVLLSGRGEAEAQRAERALAQSGIGWTVVRASWFMQNFDESYFAGPLQAGTLALPAGDVPVPFVDADDIADVAVAALTEDTHLGRVYELTGPRAMTFAEAVAEIARATGRELAYQPITLDDYAAGAGADGVPDDIVALLRYLFAEVLVVDNASLGHGVERALGRPPRDFADFARAAAATGVWSRPVAA